MKILIDICHPAHVHFFRNPIRILEGQGHEVIVTSRDKEVTLDLLASYGIANTVLSRPGKGWARSLLTELVVRNFRLWRFVAREKPDVMAAIGGIFVAQVGRLSGIPSVVFYDTENAKLQNRLTYPFASKVVVPRCYESWLPEHSERYSGYHELSYLHRDFFAPDREIAIRNGLSAERETYLVRVVSWAANHDVGEKGWTPNLLEDVALYLEQYGKVVISSEYELPDSLKRFAYEGTSAELHHLMAFCRLYVGESATMASESVVLGVPAIYAANTGRGYTNEQQERYQLLNNVHDFSFNGIVSAIDEMLSRSREDYRHKLAFLRDDTINVAELVCEQLENIGRKSLG